ncbi:MAG: hypothetical protein AAF573_22830, partial [Bacteroidota bacterium]
LFSRDKLLSFYQYKGEAVHPKTRLSDCYLVLSTVNLTCSQAKSYYKTPRFRPNFSMSTSGNDNELFAVFVYIAHRGRNTTSW